MTTRLIRLSALTALALAAACLPATAQEKKKEKATYLRAERAGWMMGMYVGEKRSSLYPFVIQVDRDSDAFAKGIREGDELVKFNGIESNPLWRIFDEVNRQRAGREVALWVRRGAETLRFFVRVPQDPGAPPSDKVEKAKKPEEPEGEAGKKKPKKKPPIVVKPIPPDGD
jgi:C-terminal processing protease CtpA/Prc